MSFCPQRVWIPVFLLLSACRADGEYGGIAVGNPGQVSMTTSSGDGITVESARARSASVSLEDCTDGAETILAENVGLDLAGGSLIWAPAGDWCSLHMEFDETVDIDGYGPQDSTFELFLEFDVLTVENPTGFAVEEAGLYLLQVGAEEWLSEASLRLEQDEHTEIDFESQLHDELVAVAMEASVFGADLDEDGELTDNDQLLAAGLESDFFVEEDDDEDEDTGDSDASGSVGGCGRSNAAVLLPLFVVPGLGRMRRRRRCGRDTR